MALFPEPHKKPLWREYLETIVIAVVLSILIINFVAQSHIVDGESMLNTLVHGQRLMVEKITYRFSEPQRGDIIIFKYPKNPRMRFVKRVIGIPGDEISIENNLVYVNGVALDEPYVDVPFSGDHYMVKVKEDHVYVLGDNRGNSYDSRNILVGQIPYDMIIGKALFSFWPLDRIGVFTNPFKSNFE